jgi:hypothetical protein
MSLNLKRIRSHGSHHLRRELQRKTFTYNIKIAIKEKPTIIYNKNSQSETKTPTDS